MTKKRHPTHRVTLRVAEPPVSQLEAGTNALLRVVAECAHGCNLAGQRIVLAATDGTIVGGGTLPESSQTLEITFGVPAEIGAHSWRLRYQRNEVHGVIHTGHTLPVDFESKPHDVSFAVWDVPSPIVKGHAFKAMIGATCSAGCDLAGTEVVIRDKTNTTLGKGKLGPQPLANTRALYWTEIELQAPEEEGRALWNIQPENFGGHIRHLPAPYAFGSEIVRVPDNRVTVTVCDRNRKTPLEGALVQLGAYRAISDSSGVANLTVTAGHYNLTVSRSGYELSSVSLDVHGDLQMRTEMPPTPKQNADAYWYYDPHRHDGDHYGS